MKWPAYAQMFLLATACGTVGCASASSGHEEATGVATAAESSAAPIVMPAVWDGSIVDVMFADALTSCTMTGPFNFLDFNVGADSYLKAASAHMKTALGGVGQGQSLQAYWWEARTCPNDSSGVCSFNQGGIKATFAPGAPPQTITAGAKGIPAVSTVALGAAVDAANQMIQAPSVNLCIAERLRGYAPGTAAGSALLLSPSDQRELLELTRERAQIAMLGFAALGRAFVEYPFGIYQPTHDNGLPDPSLVLPVLAIWAQTSNTYLAGMGQEFATAVELHAIASQDLVALLARSSDAHEPRGGHATTPAAELWGPGSWRQRVLAALYGGDPLAVERDGSSPLTSATGSTSPTQQGTSEFINGGWPDETQQPFFATDTSRPQVTALLTLARQWDVLDVVPGSTASAGVPNSCSFVDNTATAHRLYMITEAALESLSQSPPCGGATSTFPCDGLSTVSRFGDSCSPYPGSGGESGDFSGCLLYTSYGIVPNDADSAAGYLAEALSPLCKVSGLANASLIAQRLAQGSLSTGAAWWHLSPDAALVPRDLLEVEALYAKNAHFLMPDCWFGTMDTTLADLYGYATSSIDTPATTENAEGRRLAGSVAALNATRLTLRAAWSDGYMANDASVVPFFASADAILAVISAAAGDTAVSLEPNMQARGLRGIGPAPSSSGDYQWVTQVERPANDVLLTTPKVSLYVLENDPLDTALLDNPSSGVFGHTAGDVTLSSSEAFGLTTRSYNRARGVFYLGASNANGTVDNHDVVTLVATVPVSNGQATRVVLAPNVPLYAQWAPQGYYLSQGGALNTFASRLLQGLPNDPSKPAFDGFGLPRNWVPPTNPAIFGDPSGGDAAEHYLTQATQSADEATKAVLQALGDLAQEELDSQNASAAQQKASQIVQETNDGFFGAGNAAPNLFYDQEHILPSATLARHDFNNLLDVTGCPASRTQGTLDQATKNSFSHKIDCLAQGLLAPTSYTYNLAEEVFLNVNNPRCPVFSAYSGGSLQKVFIDQWNDVSRLNVAVEGLLAAYADASARAASAQYDLSMLAPTLQADCANLQLSLITSQQQDHNLYGGAVVAGQAALWKAKCQQALLPIIPGVLLSGTLAPDAGVAGQSLVAFSDAVLQLYTYGVQVGDALASLVTDGAALEQEVAQARMAQSSAQLQAQLAIAPQESGLPAFQAYHQYDLWRAQATVENARRMAVAARRAIEAKYLVDLSSLSADEPFVAAPSTWADEVYSFDLSLPSSVGLSVSNAAQTTQNSGVYPNKISDYVANLNEFVQGYAVKRAVISTPADPGVITLLGPTTPPASTDAQSTTQYDWSYQCPVSSGVAYHVGAGGYVTSGQWQGFATTYASQSSQIAPASSFTSLSDGGTLCASGSVGAASDYSGVALIGINLNQGSSPGSASGLYSPTGTGITIGVTNPGGSALRVELQGPNGATDPTQRWCASITGSGGSIPWASFNTKCWDNSGSAYDPLQSGPVTALNVKVPGDNQNSVGFNFCITNAAETVTSDQWTGARNNANAPFNPDQVCAGSKPARARIAFSLDAWGEVNSYGFLAPPSKQFNTRWNRFVVNLVGTGIKDCTRAADPLGCYSSPYVPFDLSHVGPAFITDYEGAWHTLEIPAATISQAKALTAEQWLDPVTNGWSAAYVSSVQRQDFAGRPLGGTYYLAFTVAPEVVLSNIQRVQVLTETSYWERQ